jgi:hypothetical protein
LADPAGHEAQLERLIWSRSSIGLMQAGYWMRYRFNPPLPQFQSAFVRHIILFVGSISFVFAGAVFGFAFIIRSPELQIRFFATSFWLRVCLQCSVTRKNWRDWEGHSAEQGKRRETWNELLSSPCDNKQRSQKSASVACLNDGRFCSAVKADM